MTSIDDFENPNTDTLSSRITTLENRLNNAEVEFETRLSNMEAQTDKIGGLESVVNTVCRNTTEDIDDMQDEINDIQEVSCNRITNVERRITDVENRVNTSIIEFHKITQDIRYATHRDIQNLYLCMAFIMTIFTTYHAFRQ